MSRSTMEDRVSAAADDSANRRRRFPAGFLWGAATASHQVEGGNRWNDWWEYESSGRLPFASGDCCRHYELYEQDFDLARSLGHNCHRLSLEWSRIEPEDGQWNPAAIEHYARVIRALKTRGIEPVVTLHHFTLPAWFLRRGGWECADSAQIFARFVAHTLENLGEQVGYWLTINEPTVYVMQSYINGEWPPLQRNSWSGVARVLRNLARAHVAAFAAIKQVQPDAQVGFAHSALWMEPCDPQRLLDRMATRVRDFALNGLFFR
ncbi:MAG: glycoside hydrolase family 1 protein [Gammaproteobacteria bacterium]|nr:glycoside hydrolase family 1 protein [Gammaproteobacteria bacterium]